MTATHILPLGGLGEVGLNCLALESGGDAILIDCGLLFPQPFEPGIDYLIPDFSCLRDRHTRVRAVLLTHGHDDHVGALAHFLGEFSVPIYGTALTLGLAEIRLKELLPSSRALLQKVEWGQALEIGPFRAEFLRVTHSTADAAALAVETPGGTILHTGDFKFDPSPVDGRMTDEGGLARYGAKGVDLLCCDSTNANRPGQTPSEKTVGVALRRLLPRVQGRAYVATFSSHVHRIQQVIEASREVGRSVVLAGRSMVAAARVARRLGHLIPAPGDLVPEHRCRGLARNGLTVLLTGSQGEEGSALFRVAHGLDALHGIQPGDEVFFCARRIPGNEAAIHRLLDLCLRRGARIHYEENADVHVSGHPSADDVVRMLELTRPRQVLPIHGELRHLDALSRQASAWGVPAESVFRVENGQALVLERGLVRRGSLFAAGRILVDRGELGPTGDSLLSDRRRLGEEGLALAIAAVRPGCHTPVWGPRVVLRGVFPDAAAEAATREAEAVLRRHLTLAGGDRQLTPAEWEAQMKLALRRHLRRHSGRRPLVAAVVAEVDGEEGSPLE